MEGDLGSDSVPFSGSLDKSRVLNVRPLRSLVPVFPSPHGFTTFSPPQAPPFVCAQPSGPFPPGFSPFYPFFIPPESQGTSEQHPQTPSGATNQAGVFGFNHPAQTSSTPLASFRTPAAAPTQFAWPANGDAGTSSKSFRKSETGKGESVRSAMEGDGFNENQKTATPYLSSFNMHITDAETTSNGERQKSKSHKRVKQKYNQDTKLSLSAGGDTFMTFDAIQRADGDRESVVYILVTFDALRRRITQIEDAKEATPGGIKRSDLKAGTIMMNKGIRTNTTKRVGAVPGVEVGDIFFFRFEMCLVGLHAPSMAGIDYMILKNNQEDEPVALSIVSSGAYEDNMEDGDVLIYSGQGGNINRKDKQVVDQKLERGNLALERSLRRASEVRVIRGMNMGNPTVKVYVYDGLYQIQESWIEQGKSGCNVFKYKLVRVPGQTDAFSVWKSVQQWKEGSTSRIGVILPDLTSGAETLPVSLVNDVDDERGPAYFTYFPTLKYLKPVKSLPSSFGCNCHGSCGPGDPNCSCIRRNGGNFPYSATGVLVVQKSLVHECGPSCSCNPNCRNRASQTGLKVRLEVFKTKDKGWGLRTLDPIRAGAFICEYAGEVIEKLKGDENRDQDEDDEYIFDATRTSDNSLQWNYIPGLLGEEMPGGLNEADKAPLPLTISAKNSGNVARFMNHSCSPSVFWQPVLHANNNESNLHIAFYATKHIPPMTELTYDYGIVQSEKHEAQSINARHRRKICLCGSSKCRGYFG